MIEAINIEKSYGDEKVLKGVSLTVKDGEFISVMGKSGSGKSTLLSILGGFLTPDSGKVLWSGEDISKFSDAKMSVLRSSEIGFVFQSFKLISTLNVNDNLLLSANFGKNINKELLEYADFLLKELGLSQMRKKFPMELSGGQCQRVAVARALVYRPKVIILDEPTGALDSTMEKVVMDLLLRVNREQNTTLIQVTHSPKVAGYANRIIRLCDGELNDPEDSDDEVIC